MITFENSGRTPDPAATSDKPAARRNHLFLRLTASALNSNNFAIGDISFGAMDEKIVNINHSIGVIATDDEGNQYFKSTSEGPGLNWIEFAFKDDGTFRLPQNFTIRTAPSSAGDQRNITAFKLERIYPTHWEWRMLKAYVHAPGNVDFSVQEAHQYETTFIDDPFSIPTPVTTGYVPTIDWSEMPPSIPTNIRATATSKSQVTLKWTVGADTRATWYWIYRQDTDANPNGEFVQVGTVAPTITGTSTGTSVKNNGTFSDTVPNTAGNHKYTYVVRPVEGNPGTIGEFSGPIAVTTLTDNQVYLNAVSAKISAGTPISLDEMCSFILGDQVKGGQAAAAIAAGNGTYTYFRNQGYSAGVARQLAAAGLMQSSAEQMLNQQFTMAGTVLRSNSSAATAFMLWSNGGTQGQIGLSPDDILNAADTEAEKQRIVTWMVQQGYLQNS
ncbi:hypothetical protein CCP3SC15_530021 [Gammaproteobacteria bacterium]